MPSKFNALAAQVRMLRSQAEAWPLPDDSRASGQSEQQAFSKAQWRAFRTHRKHCQLIGQPIHSPGIAQWMAKPYLSEAASRRDRRWTRGDAQWRHTPLRSFWQPVRSTTCSSIAGADDPAFVHDLWAATFPQGEKRQESPPLEDEDPLLPLDDPFLESQCSQCRDGPGRFPDVTFFQRLEAKLDAITFKLEDTLTARDTTVDFCTDTSPIEQRFRSVHFFQGPADVAGIPCIGRLQKLDVRKTDVPHPAVLCSLVQPTSPEPVAAAAIPTDVWPPESSNFMHLDDADDQQNVVHEAGHEPHADHSAENSVRQFVRQCLDRDSEHPIRQDHIDDDHTEDDYDVASGLMSLKPSFDAKLQARIGACFRLYNGGDISGAATGLFRIVHELVVPGQYVSLGRLLAQHKGQELQLLRTFARQHNISLADSFPEFFSKQPSTAAT